MPKSWREAVSRGFAGLLSAGLFYGVYRCVVGAGAAAGPDLIGRRVGLIAASIILGLIGLPLLSVALMPVGWIERLFRAKPPITGDDGMPDCGRTGAWGYADFLTDVFFWW